MSARPVLPYGRQSIDDDDVAAVVAALRGDWLTQGPTVARFEERLAEIMRGIHHRCLATADEYDVPGNYVAGANIAGFTQVADAMIALGVI